MKMHLIYLEKSFHVGSLTIGSNGVRPRSIKNWDFEFGLLSISLDPAAWVARSSVSNPTIYEIISPLKLIDADVTLANHKIDIERSAKSFNVLQPSSAIVEDVSLYSMLNLTTGTISAGGAYTKEEWILQSCLAFLAYSDPSVDGLWFSDTQRGAFPSARGGIFQHRLSSIGAIPINTMPTGLQIPNPKLEETMFQF